jgi:hypothetical protein
MNLINRLFNLQKIDCPRCLGKGEVDWDDIKRLNNELRWIPGKCAYCNGMGKISPKMLANVSADNTYLTTDISQEERKRLFNSDEGATQRANYYDSQVSNFIKQIKYLHNVGNLELDEIVNFYLIPKSEEETSLEEKQELLEYIEKVISKKKNNG